jgi:hypothetical protein
VQTREKGRSAIDLSTGSYIILLGKGWGKGDVTQVEVGHLAMVMDLYTLSKLGKYTITTALYFFLLFIPNSFLLPLPL